ncbi:unnamed protein product [Schistosoma turkestanicum]|nr:unnamed protein product [Schistosoma turkestanicum]
MGIRGLWTYIQSNSENFAPYELHNQPLIIDAENFASLCYRQAALRCEYGGEYLAFKCYVHSFLRQFRICRVDPVFVFDGCHPKEGSKLDTLLKRNINRCKNLSSALLNVNSVSNPGRSNLKINIIPPLCGHVLVEILRESSVRYIACEREADINVAELGIYLQCPVTSGDSDFYIYRPIDNNQVYKFIPFSSLVLDSRQKFPPCSVCKLNGTQCYFIPCTVLSDSGPFYKLKYPMLPLFAILVGNDMTSNIRLPTTIDSLIRTSDLQNTSYYQRRIHAIFNWLLSFRDIKQPVSLILSLYSQNERDGIEETMLLGISGYFLNTSGKDLAQILGFPTKNNVSLSVPPSSELGNPDIQNYTNSWRSYFGSFKFSKPVLERNTDQDSIFHNWPKELVRRFRFLELVPGILDRMYVRNGVVTRIVVEDIQSSNSIDECMSKMDSVLDGLIYGLEHHLRTTIKLCGVENDSVTVYRISSNGQLTKTLVSVKPIKPVCAETPESSFLSFFSQFFNVNLERDFKPVEIQGLGVLLVLWFRFSSHAQNVARNIQTSPVGLALSCCAVAVNSNCEFSRNRTVADFVSSVCTHLNKCANLAKSIYCQKHSPSFCIEDVHQLNELQSMAARLNHLVALVEVLCPFYASNIEEVDPSRLRNPFIGFFPLWTLFASGHLSYWISRILQSVDPSERFHMIVNDWLPKLLIETDSFRERQNCAKNDFTKLFNLINKLS